MPLIYMLLVCVMLTAGGWVGGLCIASAAQPAIITCGSCMTSLIPFPSVTMLSLHVHAAYIPPPTSRQLMPLYVPASSISYPFSAISLLHCTPLPRPACLARAPPPSLPPTSRRKLQTGLKQAEKLLSDRESAPDPLQQAPQLETKVKAALSRHQAGEALGTVLDDNPISSVTAWSV